MRHPVILPAAESSIRTGSDVFIDRLGIRPQIAAEVDEMAMMTLLAREGMGLAVSANRRKGRIAFGGHS